MRVGVMADLTGDTRIEDKFREIREMGMESCQLVCWDRRLLDSAVALKVKDAMEEYGITVTAFWCGWEGPKYWNFYEGQATLGLVPEAYRFQRMQMLMEGSDFAGELGIQDVVTHAGYMPENPWDPKYPEIIACLKSLAAHYQRNGQYFLFETGQETPVTLKRAIEDIGCNNLGINLDPANLIMYGKANPVDALDVFGEYIRGVHGKDGCYPVGGRELGAEVPLGQGKVDYPALIRGLKHWGYDGDITIEREISGEEQRKDIRLSKEVLERVFREVE